MAVDKDQRAPVSIAESERFEFRGAHLAPRSLPLQPPGGPGDRCDRCKPPLLILDRGESNPREASKRFPATGQDARRTKTPAVSGKALEGLLIQLVHADAGSGVPVSHS